MTQMKVFYRGELRTECVHQTGAKLGTDAPKDNQGKGEGFSPTDLFAASLGTCMLTVMGIAARPLGVDLQGATAEVEKEMASAPHRRVGRIVVRIRSSLMPNEMVRQKLERAALECPVHRSLHPDIRVEVDFVWGL